ncbi:MAG: STAS domain-containing protein [Arenibacterium sp.]
MTQDIVLPQKIDHSAIEHLVEQLKRHHDQPVRVDMSQSKGVGGLASQVLLAAMRKWRTDNLTFEFATSEAVEADLSRLGLLDEMQSREEDT